MWKRVCDTASKCIAEAKEYNKQRWDNSHMQPDFKEGDQVLVSTLSFNNLKGPKKMRDSFVGPFSIIQLIERKICSPPGQKPHSIRNSGSERLPWPCEENHQGKDQRQYMVRFKNQTANKDKWLAEEAIPDGNLHLRRLRASRRTQKSHQ
ncbi:hypothetical protein O181_058884 [Austropuccinia psidii MF-1]|uniref:Uncharacterized protein n=1 Tax=Austropuccinia psidii MF-1 TaxID=1389203 RepID=A0A9Q3EDC8_9BASI|nr:hypothetical protein [Austropuccinia psidii MF-1]